MDEKSTKQRKRGVFSSREIFYFFFALLVFALLAFIASEEWTDLHERTGSERDAKFAKSREAARTIARWGGYVISDSQVLSFNRYGGTNNSWLIYDLKKDEITDGSYLVRALERAGLYRDTLTNYGYLSGWKGNLVYATGTRGFGAWIFQWRTNSDELQAFRWADLAGGNGWKPPEDFLAVENGWIVATAFSNPQKPSVGVVWAGYLDGPMPLTKLFLTNLTKTNIVVSHAFQRDLYITVATPDKLHADIYIFSLTNQSLIFSNDAVKMPRKFDYAYARPDPSGTRVLWSFEVESKLNNKLRSILPDRFAPYPALPTWYLYSSDLHATKFNYICAMKTDQAGPHFLWGPNADSIWLLDYDEGIKRIELK